MTPKERNIEKETNEVPELFYRLRAARNLRGYETAKEFADKHGFNEATYRQHETGRRKPSDKTLQEYADILEVNYNWLKTGEDTFLPASMEDASIDDSSRLDIDKFLLSSIYEKYFKSCTKNLFKKHSNLDNIIGNYDSFKDSLFKLNTKKFMDDIFKMYSTILESEKDKKKQLESVDKTIILFTKLKQQSK